MAVKADTHPVQIDPTSSTPLYLQIAESIRARIESGDLSPGDALKPLREAAEQWGVNLHTVRHAYTALSREGLIETSRGARGTRVAPQPGNAAVRPDASQIDRDIDRLLARANTDGFSTDALIDRIRARAGGAARGAPVVYVVECSASQCESHAEEIRSRFEIDARPWPLAKGEPPEDGAIIATYFHYNDIRRAWPQRLRDVHFVTIGPNRAFFDVCAQKRGADTLVVMERDEPTAEMVMADLLSLPGADDWRIETRVIEDANAAIDELQSGELAVLPPRVWGDLSAQSKRGGRAVEVAYVIEPAELGALGAIMQWSAAQ